VRLVHEEKEQPDQIVGMTKKLANQSSARNLPTAGEKKYAATGRAEPDMTYLPIFW
jgi:hypothetical protein